MGRSRQRPPGQVLLPHRRRPNPAGTGKGKLEQVVDRHQSRGRGRVVEKEIPMRWLERFRIATLMLFRRQQQTVRLNDELQFHLDQQVKENIARGSYPEEAHYAALRTFGNPALL